MIPASTFTFPRSIAYGKRAGAAAVERAIAQALAQGHIVYSVSPRKDGDRHICTIYPFRKMTPTPLLQWPSLP